MITKTKLLNALFAGMLVDVAFSADKSSQVYTYKTFYNDLKKGDEVFVKSSAGYIRSVFVVDVRPGSEIDIDSNIEYQWVLGKVAFPEYDQVMAEEAKLKERIDNIRRDKLRENLLSELGLSLGDLPLLMGTKGGE